MISRLHRLKAADRGAVTVEFALLASLFITMLLGVLQVALGMQSYNAMRNASAEIARYAIVQYEAGNQLSNTQLRAAALNIGRNPPYMLKANRLNVVLEDAATQRVSGARELRLEIQYDVPSILGVIGLTMPRLTYERPIFLIKD